MTRRAIGAAIRPASAASATLVDQAMAAMLDSGSVAALEYANKLVMFLTGLGATALGTAALPHFSKQVARRD